MSADNTLPIMVFVAGLFLIGVGIYLCTYYEIISFTVVDVGLWRLETPHPYFGIGIAMVVVGIVFVVGALIKIRIHSLFLQAIGLGPVEEST